MYVNDRPAHTTLSRWPVSEQFTCFPHSQEPPSPQIQRPLSAALEPRRDDFGICLHPVLWPHDQSFIQPFVPHHRDAVGVGLSGQSLTLLCHCVEGACQR